MHYTHSPGFLHCRVAGLDLHWAMLVHTALIYVLETMQPWTAAEGYGGLFCCTFEVINDPLLGGVGSPQL